jgi:mRNA interferase MazF
VVPRQWHVYVVDLEPRVGTKPGKQRLCVAIQPTAFAESGLQSTVILPLSTRLVDDAFPLRVRLTKGTCGLNADSDVLVDQVLAWDNGLFRRDMGELPDAIREEVRDAVREFLDLDAGSPIARST